MKKYMNKITSLIVINGTKMNEILNCGHLRLCEIMTKT